MTTDLDLPIEILSHPTVRETDGLALSSRNAYLSTKERKIAPRLYETLQHMAAELGAGEAVEAVLAAARRCLETAGFRIDYLDIRDSQTLQSPAPDGPLRTPSRHRIFAAAYLGDTRLIDNLSIAA